MEGGRAGAGVCIPVVTRAGLTYSLAVAGDDDTARAHQAQVFRALAARLEAGEPPLPIDVASPVERELELRRDDDAIRAAWDEQGTEEPEPWVYVRGRILG